MKTEDLINFKIDKITNMDLIDITSGEVLMHLDPDKYEEIGTKEWREEVYKRATMRGEL